MDLSACVVVVVVVVALRCFKLLSPLSPTAAADAGDAAEDPGSDAHPEGRLLTWRGVRTWV